jgi:pectinesterase
MTKFFQKIGFVIFFLSLHFLGIAQSMAGVTGIPDTSYSNRSAANSIRKMHPDAKLEEAVRLFSVRESHDITYCQIGERKLQIDVFHPAFKRNEKKIAIMIVHGGGWRSGNKTQHHALAQKLATMGYVCFTPEYRLSTEALYPAAVHDLKAALRWIHKQADKYQVDTTKIAVMGFSAGGQLAALIGTTNGKKAFEGENCQLEFASDVQAIIDLDGTLSFVHPESGEGDDSKKTSAATYWFGYSKKENFQLWEQASPLTHVSKHTPPTLFINSSVDRMHAGRDDFMKALKENNIFTDVKTFDDAPHHFPMFEPWFTPMVQYIDQFLKTVFQPKNK